PERARDCEPDDRRASGGCESIAGRAACRRLGAGARLAVELLGRRARHYLESALFRHRSQDRGRPRAGRDRPRGTGVASAARCRRGVVERSDERARGRRTQAGGTERRVVTATYVKVVVLEASIITLLWMVGRVFS